MSLRRPLDHPTVTAIFVVPFLVYGMAEFRWVLSRHIGHSRAEASLDGIPEPP
jgi:hypothetical protein